MRIRLRLLSALLMLLAASAFGAVHMDRLTLPKGFHATVYSDQVPNARAIALGAKGTVFVGPMDAGKACPSSPA